MSQSSHNTTRVALVTGAARRVGAHLVETLHKAGFNTLVHYGGSRQAADDLVSMLNDQRDDSATSLCADLGDTRQIDELAARTIARWGRLDLLVNNASTFYPTALGETDPGQWQDLFDVNLRAPYFLAQALAPELRMRRGAIVNITDIYAERPLSGYAPYCAAKAGLLNLTRSLAIELAPEVRVNAIAPGAILWPEGDSDDAARDALLRRTPLRRTGDPSDIANTLLFLVRDGGFVTGQVINVDGGRSIVP